MTSTSLEPAGTSSGAGGLAVAGLAAMSTCDWPGHLVATAFLQGCPWSCTYCHNPALIDPRSPGTVAWSAVRELLGRRAGLLDGVVFSGGEPTRQPQLLDAVLEVRELGFGVGLHTGGAYPRLLARLLPHVDWVGFDVKGTPEQYPDVVGRGGAAARAMTSLTMLIEAGVDFEVRTTIDPSVHTPQSLLELHEDLTHRGVRRHVLQLARTTGATQEYVRSREGLLPADVVPTQLAHLVRDA